MTQQKQDLLGFTTMRVNVGTSQLIGITVSPTWASVIVGQFSGGTLWFGGTGLTPANGWLLGSVPSSPLSGNISGTFYLTASGSTAIASILIGIT